MADRGRSAEAEDRAPLWARLRGEAGGEITAAQVQFALFATELERQARSVTLRLGEHEIALRY
ncbi:MAG: hypothetical protein V9G18_03485 [Albidovulum sp.]